MVLTSNLSIQMPTGHPMDHKPTLKLIEFHVPLRLHVRLECDSLNQHQIHRRLLNRSNHHNYLHLHRLLLVFLFYKHIRLMSILKVVVDFFRINTNTSF